MHQVFEFVKNARMSNTNQCVDAHKDAIEATTTFNLILPLKYWEGSFVDATVILVVHHILLLHFVFGQDHKPLLRKVFFKGTELCVIKKLNM